MGRYRRDKRPPEGRVDEKPPRPDHHHPAAQHPPPANENHNGPSSHGDAMPLIRAEVQPRLQRVILCKSDVGAVFFSSPENVLQSAEPTDKSEAFVVEMFVWPDTSIEEIVGNVKTYVKLFSATQSNVGRIGGWILDGSTAVEIAAVFAGLDRRPNRKRLGIFGSSDNNRCTPQFGKETLDAITKKDGVLMKMGDLLILRPY